MTKFNQYEYSDKNVNGSHSICNSKVEKKNLERLEIQKAMQEYLNKGGKIEILEPDKKDLYPTCGIFLTVHHFNGCRHIQRYTPFDSDHYKGHFS